MPVTRQDTRLSDALIDAYERDGYWDSTTLTDLLEHNLTTKPDLPAFLDGQTQLTWRQLWETSESVAAGLRARGVVAGDVVAVQLPNRVEFVVLLAAVARLGAVLCQFPPDYRTREVELILSFSEARVVVVPERWKSFDYPAMIDQMRPRLPALQLALFLSSDGASQRHGWLELAELTAGTVSGLESTGQVRPDANDVMRIAFTSGTTGDPKAVLHTHNTTIFTNRRQNEQWGITAQSRLLVLLPVGLNVGLFAIIQTCVAGATAILMDQFDAGDALALIERERITTFLVAPTALIALLNHPSLSDRDVTSLQLVQTGGASTPMQVLREANTRLGCPVVDVYGMLESGWTSCTCASEPFEEWVGTVGRPHPWLQVRILDPDGTDFPPGAQGEITKTGPSICVGYFRNSAKNAESWTADGWFRSGDLGSIDAQGRLRITGRTKDMIIHGGANIWPRELEELLHLHPRVLDVTVIGVPDDYFGENVCACVIPHPETEIDLQDVIDFLRGQVAKYKLPQRLELFDEFPTGPTGKIAKQVLRDQVARRV
ncbi:MAG: hypothetical protein DLM61_10800 [Pseudonocardiales bacterium]|nr:MAG: hypothetical protein DLM61_10800 [Pseudonocardiales bacterium]